MRVAIIGAGRMGTKRAAALGMDDQLVYVCDKDQDKASALAIKYGASFTLNSRDIVQSKDVDVVIISVINKYVAQIATEMLRSGKHILCEKPLGINSKESLLIIEQAQQSGKLVKTGFNHRFHPAMLKAKEIIDQGVIGSILNMRARYGHGGRPGMENEWRCSKDFCGGGELLDQGIHIIDLCRWFAGSAKEVYGKVLTSFWPIEVEDNAFFQIFFSNNVVAQCHVSWTNWRNIFSFEIHGTGGYVVIKGLGGNYGPETLEFGERKEDGGKPEIQCFEYPTEDISWVREWETFKDTIGVDEEIIGNGEDGLVANQLVEAIYRSNNLNAPVTLSR